MPRVTATPANGLSMPLSQHTTTLYHGEIASGEPCSRTIADAVMQAVDKAVKAGADPYRAPFSVIVFFER